jgi:hypothetical protein
VTGDRGSGLDAELVAGRKDDFGSGERDARRNGDVGAEDRNGIATGSSAAGAAEQDALRTEPIQGARVDRHALAD